MGNAKCVTGTNDMSDNTHKLKRLKRVRRLKRMIVIGLVLAIMFPIIFCFNLLGRVHSLESQLAQISIMYENQSVMPQKEETPQQADTVQSEDAVKDEVKPEETYRKVYLTFDDGPSANTEQILDILDQYGVKATFFVTGEEAASHPERYQEIADRGHTIGMHSYSHKYSEIYESKESFLQDLKKLQDFLYDIIGVRPTIYRFPGGSSNTVSTIPMKDFCECLSDEGITYFDWNISSMDASNPMLSPEEIVANCADDLEGYENAVILLHDSVKKSSTVEALPNVIERIQAMKNTQILPITDDTVIVQHKNTNE